ncbi:unnamed protein product [Ilex paraguariensis]|uniref:Uncharacterized protein n=1 Tax=Ilex paraguariensis TaxID=185542 RepID=A0ABC8UKU2_9AQUA
MSINVLRPRTLTFFPPFPPIQFHSLALIKITPSNRTSWVLRGRKNRIFRVVRSSMREDKFLEVEDAKLLVETCITRTLPPALTLEQGLEKIKEAVEELKSKPPSCARGMYRIQVAVPPSAKALKWFCCQPELSKAFPLFFLSKKMENPTYQMLSLDRTRGVFGLGAAFYIKSSFSCASAACSAFQRYLLVDSTLVMAYGFVDANLDTTLSTMKSEMGPFYLFIPQIELDEFEGISMLATTLAWDDCLLCTFEEAVQTYEFALYQARQQFWPITEEYCNKRISPALRKFSVVEDKNAQMVRMSALLLGRRNLAADAVEMVSPLSWLSPNLAIANSMNQAELEVDILVQLQKVILDSAQAWSS